MQKSGSMSIVVVEQYIKVSFVWKNVLHILVLRIFSYSFLKKIPMF